MSLRCRIQGPGNRDEGLGCRVEDADRRHDRIVRQRTRIWRERQHLSRAENSIPGVKTAMELQVPGAEASIPKPPTRGWGFRGFGRVWGAGGTVQRFWGSGFRVGVRKMWRTRFN